MEDEVNVRLVNALTVGVRGHHDVDAIVAKRLPVGQISTKLLSSAVQKT